MTDKPEPIFKPGEEYRTRGYYPARVYATDARGGFPVHGAIFKNGEWRVAAWTKEGKRTRDVMSPSDLMPPKPKPRAVWIWDWDNAGLSIGHFTTPEAAADGHNPDKGHAVKFREVTEDE